MAEEKKMDWISLIVGIFFLIASFIAFRNPLASLSSLVIYFGLSALFKGIAGVFAYNKLKKIVDFSATPFLIISIIDIVLGLLIVFNFEVGLLGLPFIFAIWFIVDSINDLIFGRHLKKIHGGLYGLNIVTNIITLILGVLMLFNPLSAYFTIVYIIGLYLAINGIKYIVNAFNA